MPLRLKFGPYVLYVRRYFLVFGKIIGRWTYQKGGIRRYFQMSFFNHVCRDGSRRGELSSARCRGGVCRRHKLRFTNIVKNCLIFLNFDVKKAIYNILYIIHLYNFDFQKMLNLLENFQTLRSWVPNQSWQRRRRCAWEMYRRNYFQRCTLSLPN